MNNKSAQQALYAVSYIQIQKFLTELGKEFKVYDIPVELPMNFLVDLDVFQLANGEWAINMGIKSKAVLNTSEVEE